MERRKSIAPCAVNIHVPSNVEDSTSERLHLASQYA